MSSIQELAAILYMCDETISMLIKPVNMVCGNSLDIIIVADTP